MDTDNTPNPGPESTESTDCDLEDLTTEPTPAGLRTLTSYEDVELIEALDDACQHISGKAWTVTALAKECIRRANERNDAA